MMKNPVDAAPMTRSDRVGKSLDGIGWLLGWSGLWTLLISVDPIKPVCTLASFVISFCILDYTAIPTLSSLLTVKMSKKRARSAPSTPPGELKVGHLVSSITWTDVSFWSQDGTETMSEGEVVGWGKTLTDKDKLIDIVSTALQQKLSMELMSNKECGDRYYEDMGIDLRGKIRWDQENAQNQ